MTTHSAITLYLELIKQTLCGALYPEMEGTIWPERVVTRALLRRLLPSDVRMFRKISKQDIEEGRTWPSVALSMIGLKRMDNIRFCVEDVLRREVPGDLI